VLAQHIDERVGREGDVLGPKEDRRVVRRSEGLTFASCPPRPRLRADDRVVSCPLNRNPEPVLFVAPRMREPAFIVPAALSCARGSAGAVLRCGRHRHPARVPLRPPGAAGRYLAGA
jgi:hypothetical protein